MLTQFVCRDVKDIDIYVGILAENPLLDGILGPVGSCIIADQFLRSKVGDRFWYETDDPAIRFTSGNLEIRFRLILAQFVNRLFHCRSTEGDP